MDENAERRGFGEWFSKTFVAGTAQGSVWLAWQAGAAWQRAVIANKWSPEHEAVMESARDILNNVVIPTASETEGNSK